MERDFACIQVDSLKPSWSFGDGFELDEDKPVEIHPDWFEDPVGAPADQWDLVFLRSLDMAQVFRLVVILLLVVILH